MTQLQSLRMQGLAPKSAQAGDKLCAGPARQLQSSAVDGISEQRVTPVGKVHPDLVCPTRLEADVESRVVGEALANPVVRDRRLAARSDDGHTRPLARVPTDRFVDGTAADESTAGHGHVIPAHGFSLQLLHEAAMSALRRSHDQYAGGVLVETMHDTGTRQPGEAWTVSQQGIHERTAAVAGPGMNHETSGFVDDDEILVFVQQDKGQDLALPGHFVVSVGHKCDLRPDAHPIARPRGGPIVGQAPSADPRL